MTSVSKRTPGRAGHPVRDFLGKTNRQRGTESSVSQVCRSDARAGGRRQRLTPSTGVFLMQMGASSVLFAAQLQRAPDKGLKSVSGAFATRLPKRRSKTHQNSISAPLRRSTAIFIRESGLNVYQLVNVWKVKFYNLVEQSKLFRDHMRGLISATYLFSDASTLITKDRFSFHSVPDFNRLMTRRSSYSGSFIKKSIKIIFIL